MGWFFRSRAVATGGIAAVMAISTPIVAEWEGLRVNAYKDVVGVTTICYGHTKTAQMGQTKTKDECFKLLEEELKEYVIAVDEAVTVDMRPQTHAAFASFAFNMGVGAFQRSTLLKKMNAGNTAGACGELLRWNKAQIWNELLQANVLAAIRGLTRRREAENRLCMMGI